MIKYTLCTIAYGLINVVWVYCASAQTIITKNYYSGVSSESQSDVVIRLSDGVIRSISAASETTKTDDDYIEGKWVTPGLFSAFSRVGLVEVAAEKDSDDRGASSTPFSVSLKAVDGFNPAGSAVGATRIEGVTHLALAPTGSANIFVGQGGIVNTSAAIDSTVEDTSFVFVRMGEAGARLSGGSRAASWGFFKAALRDARTYPGRYTTHADGGEALVQADANALKAAALGNQLMIIEVNRAQDIMQVIELTKQSSTLDIAILGAAEGHLVADSLAKAGIPVIIDPSQNLPSRFESVGASLDNAQALISAGVLTAFAYFDDDAHQSRLLPQIAGIAVANGVSHADSMAAITSVPAEIFGQRDYGRIKQGEKANLVVWDGDPLELSSRPIAIFIDGARQSLESRQTNLRNRYLKKLGETNR